MVFEDPDFPPGPSSIGNLEEKHNRWYRLGELDAVAGKPVLFGKLEADNIEQGQLGDCWLLAALAAIADFPGHVEDLFSPREYNPEGRYEVRLNHITEGWQTIVIDDRIPCLSWAAQPCYVQVPATGALWVILLEKAFAKFSGTYENLDGGSSAWAYQALTGINRQLIYMKDKGRWHQWHVNIKKQQADPDAWRRRGMKGISLTSPCPGTQYDADEMFGVIAYYDQSCCMMTASISGSVMEAKRDDGLIETHAYSVLEAQKVHGKCMIKLRNPWGDQEWKGKFSDKSDEWDRHPDIAEDLKVEEENNGEFWMPWEDFNRIYDSVKVSPGCLPVPKQSRIGGRKKDGMKCCHCKNTMTRVWAMTDFDGGHGEWTRLQDGDLCFMCRKAQTGLADVRPELSSMPGLDTYPPEPPIYKPEAPRAKEECMFGPQCYRYNPEHFADYAHPWLGVRKGGKPWKKKPHKSSSHLPSTPSGGGGGDGKPGDAGAGDEADVVAQAHAMLNAFRDGWGPCSDLLRANPKIVNMHPDGRDWAIIHKAAAAGDVAVVRELVEDFGADPELLSCKGMTPLQVAEHGADRCADVAKYLDTLLRSKSSPASTEEDEYSFLRNARRRRWPAAMSILAEKPGIVNCCPPGEKFYAVHHAAFQGRMSEMQTLVENYRADIDVEDSYGQKPMDTAKSRGNAVLVRYLETCAFRLFALGASAGESKVVKHFTEPVLEGSHKTLGGEEPGADPSEEDAVATAMTEIAHAARNGDWDTVFSTLASHPEVAGVRPPGHTWGIVHQAARAGDIDVLRRLIKEFKVDPGLRSADGRTPADIAARYGHQDTANFLQAAHVRAMSGVGGQDDDGHAARMVEVFQKWDLDGNGVISNGELTDIISKLNPDFKEGTIKRMFENADLNTDGDVDYEEFVAWILQ